MQGVYKILVVFYKFNNLMCNFFANLEYSHSRNSLGIVFIWTTILQFY